jgi:hypothetical protein
MAHTVMVLPLPSVEPAVEDDEEPPIEHPVNANVIAVTAAKIIVFFCLIVTLPYAFNDAIHDRK